MHILPSSFSSSKLSSFYFHPPRDPAARLPYTPHQTLRILCAKRVGKQRYPSEKKKLKLKHKEILQDLKDKNKFEGTWRLYKLGVPVDKDPGKDFLDVSDGLLQEIAKVLEFPVNSAFSFFDNFFFTKVWVNENVKPLRAIFFLFPLFSFFFFPFNTVYCVKFFFCTVSISGIF